MKWCTIISGWVHSKERENTMCIVDNDDIVMCCGNRRNFSIFVFQIQDAEQAADMLRVANSSTLPRTKYLSMYVANHQEVANPSK